VLLNRWTTVAGVRETAGIRAFAADPKHTHLKP
jgi:hypothetical protein